MECFLTYIVTYLCKRPSGSSCKLKYIHKEITNAATKVSSFIHADIQTHTHYYQITRIRSRIIRIRLDYAVLKRKPLFF